MLRAVMLSGFACDTATNFNKNAHIHGEWISLSEHDFDGGTQLSQPRIYCLADLHPSDLRWQDIWRVTGPLVAPAYKTVLCYPKCGMYISNIAGNIKNAELTNIPILLLISTQRAGWISRPVSDRNFSYRPLHLRRHDLPQTIMGIPINIESTTRIPKQVNVQPKLVVSMKGWTEKEIAKLIKDEQMASTTTNSPEICR